jgi:hypothetical protein
MNDFVDIVESEKDEVQAPVVTESTIESNEESKKELITEEEQDPELDKFLAAEKLFLILTNSGKPVYSS